MTQQPPPPAPCLACNGDGSHTLIDYQNGQMICRTQKCGACQGTGRST